MTSDIYQLFQEKIDTVGGIQLIDNDRLSFRVLLRDTLAAVTGSYDTALILPCAAYLEEIVLNHPSAGGSLTTVTFEKRTGTTAKGAGQLLLTTPISLFTPARVRKYGTLVSDTAVRTFAKGDCVGLIDNAIGVGSLRHLVMHFQFKRLGTAFSNS